MYPERSKSITVNNFIVIVLLTTIIAAGCGSTGEVRLDMADNGRQIEVEVDQILVISLESNPTTGFGWELIEIEDPILQSMGDAEFQPSESKEVVGAGGIGILLYSSINQFLWQEVAVILIAVFGVVLVSEFISATVRQRIT